MCISPLETDAPPVDTSANRLPCGRGEPVRIWINGKTALAYPGEMVSTALMAHDILQFRHSLKKNAPRGLFCGMGVCFECLVTIDGIPDQQACLTPIAAGMRIETGR